MTATTAKTYQDESVAGFDRSIGAFFRDAATLSRREPGQALFFLRGAARQRRAAARRRRWEERGVIVPPLMIVSVTRRCNLSCANCFVHAHGRPEGSPLTKEELWRLFTEARELGVSVVALAGGEPLTRPEILELAAGFPDMLFLLVTNGSLLGGPVLDRLERARNIIPIVSLEGSAGETDERRGSGVYARVLEALEQMQARRIFFGTSLMLTRTNFSLATSPIFVRELVSRGCRLFFYVDYVPVAPGTEHLVLSEAQRRSEGLSVGGLRRRFPAVFLSSSASEETFGGCMAAGRGFVHVNPEGDVEPCPFSPFSDSSVCRMTLREALGSRLLSSIRESGEHLSESEDGCALRRKRDWLQVLLSDGERFGAEHRREPGHPRTASEPAGDCIAA